MNFKMATEAAFVTRHLMAEKGIKGPVEPYLKFGYTLMLEDPPLYGKIARHYELAIRRAIKDGLLSDKAFQYVPLTR